MPHGDALYHTVTLAGCLCSLPIKSAQCYELFNREGATLLTRNFERLTGYIHMNNDTVIIN